MSTGSTDSLVRLINSLSKAEKRSFKLYANRNSSSADELKFLQLFDFIERTENYSDELALQRLPAIKKSQLSNIKGHLYKQILTSLRLQYTQHLPQIEIRESIDHASILYRKGFYHQALKILERARQQARKMEATVLYLEIVQLEKFIEGQQITRSMASRADELTIESQELNRRVSSVVDFSNLSLQLYALYLKNGFVRDEKDVRFVKEFFHSRLPKYAIHELGFEEKMHLYHANFWYYYMQQEFLMCFRYASLWVELFTDNVQARTFHVEMYLKGLYNLNMVLFNLRSPARMDETLERLRSVHIDERENENLAMFRSYYSLIGEINGYYLRGQFSEGLWMVSEVENFIVDQSFRLDNHRVMLLYYKVACLYFGSGDNRMAIRYLNKIIQMRDVSLREDIQCFARILNLIAHFELDDNDRIDYQVKSVYRFLSNMGDMQGVQMEIMRFLRQLPYPDSKSLTRAFRILHAKLVKLSLDPYQKRPFLYLDIISWLECKIQGKTVQEVIRSKFLHELNTGEKIYFPPADQELG